MSQKLTQSVFSVCWLLEFKPENMRPGVPCKHSLGLRGIGEQWEKQTVSKFYPRHLEFHKYL